MSQKYYSYSSKIVFNNNIRKQDEEEVVIDNNRGRLIRKKNGRLIEDKIISKKEFMDYLSKKRLQIDENIVNSALDLFNFSLLPFITDSRMKSPSKKAILDSQQIKINNQKKAPSKKAILDSQQVKINNQNRDNKLLNDRSSYFRFLLKKKAGLNKKERKFLDKNLNKTKLIDFISKRYNVSKDIFTEMTKKQILNDLKNPKRPISQNGGFNNLQEPSPGYNSNVDTITKSTLDYSFPDLN